MPNLTWKIQKSQPLVVSLIFVFLSVIAAQASVVELSAVGKIESMYRNRVTMRIIRLIGSDTEHLPVSEGAWVSFDLPPAPGKRRNRRSHIGYGDIVEAALIGSIATEYEISEEGSKAHTNNDSEAPVFLWTAQSVVKVKNPNDYLTEEEKKARKDRKRGKKGRKKDKKPKEPVKIWTQEETVRGRLNWRKKEKRMFIKEDRMGKRDKGLEIINDVWYEKLKDMHGQKIVVYGVTHRTSISSGTIEIKNILKVYPK